MRKKTTTLLALLALLLTWMPCQAGTDKIVVAYVASWTTGRLPDPTLMTHINYAFGHVKKTFDGVDIQNPDFLKEVVALKQQNPKLKVVLSVGGWTSGNFSEMAASAQYRRAFAKDCRRVVDQYGLDGIDIDWEYPTSSVAGISSSPDDTDNYTLLMRDLRKALGKKKLLTAATVADARYIDFNGCLRYMDFVNIMAYDVANPPKHHTTLYRSPLSGRITVQEAVEAQPLGVAEEPAPAVQREQPSTPQLNENRVYDLPKPAGVENKNLVKKRIKKVVILYDDHSFSEYYPED